jgi:hypothetical protein
VNHLEKRDNVFFLYDMSMIRFIANYKNTDFEETMIALDRASTHFLWFYRNMKSKRQLIGYDLALENDKFKLELVFTGLPVEFRAPWVQQLGRVIERHYDFDKPLHVSYEDLGDYEVICDEISSDEG